MLADFKNHVRLMSRAFLKPRFKRDQILDDLRRLGIRQGDLLFVHSSLSSLGYVPGGAPTVLALLRESLGSTGTLVLPTHTWLAVNKGARSFDARTSRSCVGALSEMFRTMPGVVRSLHPTHSVAAIGPQAEEIVARHEAAATPCGQGSPYARLLERGGSVLFLGAGLESNTCFHTIEALCNVEYLMQSSAAQFEITDANGQSRFVDVKCHAQHIPRRFAEFRTPLIEARSLAAGSVGQAPSMLLNGTRFLELMQRALTRAPTMLLRGGAPMVPLTS